MMDWFHGLVVVFLGLISYAISRIARVMVAANERAEDAS